MRPHYIAAALAFASQLIHLIVIPGQFIVAAFPAAFFLLVAVGQGMIWASLLFGPRRPTIWLGMMFNVFIVFVWCFTKVVSFPSMFEPIRLPVEGLGLVATLIEIALIVSLFRLRKHVPKRNTNLPASIQNLES